MRHMWLWLSTAYHISFLLIWFSVKYKFSFQIWHTVSVTSLSITQRSVSQENAFKMSKNRSLFVFAKTIGSNNSFTLIWNNVFKIAKSKIQGNNVMVYGKKAPSCEPLSHTYSEVIYRVHHISILTTTLFVNKNMELHSNKPFDTLMS